MRVDALAVDLRPRSMMEASDLGVRLVQSCARDVWACYTSVFLVVLAIALSTVEIAPWLPTTLIFCFKPWLDRSLLYVLSRAVFGERTRPADLWRDQRKVWWSQLISTFTLRRLSPWRSFTQPVHQLEGQRGSALRKRRGQLLRGKHGTALLMHAAFHHLEWAFLLSIFALGLWLQPSGRGNFFYGLINEGGIVATLSTTIAYAAIVLVVEPFYVSAGFAMYLNRRVELEAWDIEQEFRRAFG